MGRLPWQAWLAIVVAIVILVPVAAMEAFRHPLTIFIFVRAFAPLGLVGVGQTLVMASGGIDLSLGSTFGISAMLLATLTQLGYGFGESLVVCLGAGIVIGLINGFLVTKLKFMPFIATFAMLAIVRAGAFIMHYTIMKEIMLTVKGTVWVFIASEHSPLWLPPSTFILIGCAIGGWFLLSRTRFGLQAYATGGNLNAARAAGLPVDRVRILTYVIAGILAAVAGMLSAGALVGVRPYFGGGMELLSLAAAVIGGASLAGGAASILGTMLAVVLFVMADRGLAIIGLAPHTQEIALGMIVLVALVVTRLVPGGAVGKKESY